VRCGCRSAPEALSIEDQALEFRLQGDRRLEATARAYLSYILLELGELDRAEDELRIALANTQPPMRPAMLAGIARVLLIRGQSADALDAASEAVGVLEQLGSVEEGESLVRIIFVEALLANGDRDAARVAVRTAYVRLVERADRITDPEWRRMFVERVPENARTIELARELGVA
jgi:ATP/maltotriose-dependent transcriptional regulator MalT